MPVAFQPFCFKTEREAHLFKLAVLAYLHLAFSLSFIDNSAYLFE